MPPLNSYRFPQHAIMAKEEPLEDQEHENETHQEKEQVEEEREIDENSPEFQALLKIELEKRERIEADWLKSDLAKGIPHVGLAGGKPRKLSNPPPFEISPEERIKFLESCLDGTGQFGYVKWSPDQQANMKLLIEAYSKGELGPMSTYPKHSYAAACNGRIFDHPPTKEERDGHDVWTEEFGYQMVQDAKGAKAPQQQMQQMKTWSAYDLDIVSSMHQFEIEMRLCIHPANMPNWFPIKDSTLRSLGKGGLPEVTTRVEVHNDTGSNLLTVFDTDLWALGSSEATYWAIEAPSAVRLAAGHSVMMRCMPIEIRVLDRHGYPMTPWFEERGVLVEYKPGSIRLSGLNIRNELYFVTNRSNIMYTGRSKSSVFQVTDKDFWRQQHP